MRVFLSVLAASVALTFLAAPPVSADGTFTDDDGSVHESAIEAIAAEGITTGCNPPDFDHFCPADPVTRGQMAAFLARAFDLPDAPAKNTFTDDDNSVFEADIEKLAAAEITAGCNPPDLDQYCPADPVTRGQMAAFLARAFDLPDAPAKNTFTDDDNSVFEADIEKLAAAEITAGCNPPDLDQFCPSDSITRGQMATFLARGLGLALTPVPPAAACEVFPSDNIWNTKVDTLPLDPRSSVYIASMGNGQLHPDFGSGFWPPQSDSPLGIPFVEVGAGQALVDIDFTAYGSESDPGPYPVPADAPVEGGPDGTGDRHVIVVDTDDCVLYEMFNAFPQTGGSWTADSGAVFDLKSHDLRPDGWTSADAAGLPIFAGLVRYDEVADGAIEHAIRFTASQTQQAYVWPARHFASSNIDPDIPPMGQRFRMKADFDISGFHPDVQVILTAFKEYGLILADNGSSWFVTGAPDDRWDNDVLDEIKTVPGSAFEAVDVSGLMIDPDSGQAIQP